MMGIQTCFHKVFLFLTFLSLEVCIDAVCPVQAGWSQKINEANSEELNSLKEQCSIMLARRDNSVKTERRWANRFKLMEQREKALRGENKKTSNSNLTRQKPAKKQRTEDTPIEEWPENFELLSSNHLNFLQAHCLKMSEYEDLLPEGKVWSSRLNQLEIFQKSLQKQRIEQSKRKGSEQQEELAGVSTYTVRFIYVDPKNPTVLDLHGVASASVAQKKVEEFIRAAKAKRKECVKVITGKGNHINSRGRQGVLFKSFPNWITDNTNVNGYKVSKEGGGYVVSLYPSSKVEHDEATLLEHHLVYKEIKKKVNTIQVVDIYKKYPRLRHEEKLAKRNKLIGYYDNTSQFISYAYGKKLPINTKELDDEPWAFPPDL